MSRETAVEHARAHFDEYYAGFLEFLKIESVSTDAAYNDNVAQCATWLVAHLQELGFDNAKYYPTEGGHPAVYADWLHAGEDKPTVLIYAHYDVQPVDPLDKWDTPPFEPTERDGLLYARGVVDDKSGVWMVLKGCQAAMAVDGGLPVNVKLIFEGMEEAGSKGMDGFIRDHTDLLAADFIVISDGVSAPNMPNVLGGVRGIAGAEVFISGPEADVHSGLLGGVVHNPLHKAAEIIASFHDERGNITIEGFYDDVLEPTEAERARFADREELAIGMMKGMSGDFKVWGDERYSFLERAAARPTLDVNGITGGYQDEGMKTIIPGYASFKVTMRLAPDQDPQDIAEKFERHVMSFADETTAIKVVAQGAFRPSLMLQDGPIIEALQAAHQMAWGRPAVIERTGGSVPIVGMFEEHLNVPITNVSLAVGGSFHAPNEYFVLEYFQPCLETALNMLYTFGELEL